MLAPSYGLKIPSWKCLPPILCSFPPDPRIPPRFVRNLLLRPQNVIFPPSKNLLVFCFHFFSQKYRKSWIWGSQNLPKILPKRLQKRCPKKFANFHGFLLDFCCLLQEPNLKIHAPTQCFVDFSVKSQLWKKVRQIIEKSSPNPSKTLSKSFQNREKSKKIA